MSMGLLPESGEPRHGADANGAFQLTFRQDRLLQLLASDSYFADAGEGASKVLLGSLQLLAATGIPHRHVFVAHGFREVIEKLGKAAGIAVRVKQTTTNQDYQELYKSWQGWHEQLAAYIDGRERRAPHDGLIRRVLNGFRVYFDTQRTAQPSMRERNVDLLRHSRGRAAYLADAEQQRLGKRLDELHDFFTSVCHQRTIPAATELESNVDDCVNILFECLQPAVFDELEELDRLMAQEGNK